MRSITKYVASTVLVVAGIIGGATMTAVAHGGPDEVPAPQPLEPAEVRDAPSEEPGVGDAAPGRGEGYDYTTMSLKVDGVMRSFRVPLRRELVAGPDGTQKEVIILDTEASPAMQAALGSGSGSSSTAATSEP